MEEVFEYDVAVCGGGPAGVSAAVSCAREGLKTAIIERYGYLGGQSTGGLVILIVGLTDGKEQIIKGFCEEVIQSLLKENQAKNLGPHILFDPETLKRIFDNYMQEDNLYLRYHSFVSEIVLSGSKVMGVVTTGKDGKKLIKAKVFIDATGDADIAEMSGIRTDIDERKNLMPLTIGFRAGGIDTQRFRKFADENPDAFNKLITDLGISVKIGGWTETLHPNTIWFNISHIENIYPFNTEELTKAEIKGRWQIYKLVEAFRKSADGCENIYIIDTASQIGIRETRRIKGLYRLGAKDEGLSFYDTIARAPDYSTSGGHYNIPYRCLISEKIKNLIICGRSISVEKEILNNIREIPCCMATGQAAGVAAAIAVKSNKHVEDINIDELTKRLKSQGVLI